MEGRASHCHCHPGPSLSEVPAKGRGEVGGGGLCSVQPPPSPPPARRAEHRETEPPEMSLPGCRPRALPSLCFCLCAVLLACAVGEQERVDGCGGPEAAWSGCD